MEFEERRVQKKKQNRPPRERKKKSPHVSSMAEIDGKLENLLLDTDRGSNNVHCGLASRAVISESRNLAIEVNATIRDPVLDDIDLTRSCTYYGDAMSCREVVPSAAAPHEVIDLLSPSPQIRHRAVSKLRIRSVNEPQCRIDVIDLSDSETDVSPEHQRKAKELRSFLISIKDDDVSK